VILIPAEAGQDGRERGEHAEGRDDDSRDPPIELPHQGATADPRQQ
jgi:hypothetical protein